jgi:hypothetical protein
MAIYVSASRRRRRVLGAAAAALALGLLVGFVVGRMTAPTLATQVAHAQERGRAASSQLRVLALHAESGATSQTGSGDGGVTLALERAKAELTSALDDAPWIPPTRRQRLLAEIDGLAEETKAKPDQRAFASSVTEVADQIDAAFGLSG